MMHSLNIPKKKCVRNLSGGVNKDWSDSVNGGVIDTPSGGYDEA